MSANLAITLYLYSRGNERMRIYQLYDFFIHSVFILTRISLLLLKEKITFPQNNQQHPPQRGQSPLEQLK